MDCYDQATRSKAMRSVHGKNTLPEMQVRRMLFRAGFRFRLHDAKLPGKPDIILPKYRTIIFVNGCFWHRHPGCKKATTPSSNTVYWEEKFKQNVDRDQRTEQKLKELGWNLIIVWECELKQPEFLASLPDKICKCINKG